MEVRAWIERVTIPTYPVGEPEKLPVFLEKRIYQGSSGAVYPNPVIEKIYDRKEDREYTGLFLENQYLKILILPELGGRVQMAYDKIRDRHFVYYNEVIKPALVGLTGPWISGGIEFNWPQHHRPSTFEALDYRIEARADGSKTVWVSELEKMTRTRGTAGFTLYPGSSYLEVRVRLYNRTPLPRTFLWWANPAVHVNEHFQCVFPPDVHAVFDHGKRDVSGFPVARGTYYKVDYSKGVDISWYRNIPVPTSYMAIRSKYDFMGGYEHDTGGGMLHVADHHVSPGKKMWTWGNGDFGRAWERQLTDDSGPYIELMCGVYTDNQPDFAWLHPYEQKEFRQYFLPYYGVGMVKNASRHALLNLEMRDGKIELKAAATGSFPQARIILERDGEILLNERVDLTPEMFISRTLNPRTAKGSHGKTGPCRVRILDLEGNLLVGYTEETGRPGVIPGPATPAPHPANVRTTEELYLHGLHLEQYRHATRDPGTYYLEALRREPLNIRNNLALGIRLLGRGLAKEAEACFRRAIERLTLRNPNPSDGEAYYYLGLSLLYQGKTVECVEAFHKSAWNFAWQDASYFQLARLKARESLFTEALGLIGLSLSRNRDNHSARGLKTVLLRKLGRTVEAEKYAGESLSDDGFNVLALHERFLLLQEDGDRQNLEALLRYDPHKCIEYSIEYGMAGFFDEALAILAWYTPGEGNVYPMTRYFRGWYQLMAGRTREATDSFREASMFSPDFCFPNRIEEVRVLEDALALNPEDGRAWIYLGNYWYANLEHEKAAGCWKASLRSGPGHAVTWRNLALYHYNKKNEPQEAMECMRKAFHLDPSPRMLMEFDQLHRKLNLPYGERLSLLEKWPEQLEYRDDIYLERAYLYFFLGKPDRVLSLLLERNFHPWEGGEGKVSSLYNWTRLELARRDLVHGKPDAALHHLEQAGEWPGNLGEGKLPFIYENDLHYWMGLACLMKGKEKKAGEFWELAAVCDLEPAPAVYYNDPLPENILYQVLALKRLGRLQEALDRAGELLSYGEAHRQDEPEIDYFAVSYPDILVFEEDFVAFYRQHCKFMVALGYMGLSRWEDAGKALDEILAVNRYHLGAFLHRLLIHKYLPMLEA